MSFPLVLLSSYKLDKRILIAHSLPTDGPYGNFAGRDASRGMAKQSFALGKPHTPFLTLCLAYVFLSQALTKTYCYPALNSTTNISSLTPSDMLTPIDQPLDKLDDLPPDEMYASFSAFL